MKIAKHCMHFVENLGASYFIYMYIVHLCQQGLAIISRLFCLVHTLICTTQLSPYLLIAGGSHANLLSDPLLNKPSSGMRIASRNL